MTHIQVYQVYITETPNRDIGERKYKMEYSVDSEGVVTTIFAYNGYDIDFVGTEEEIATEAERRRLLCEAVHFGTAEVEIH